MCLRALEGKNYSFGLGEVKFTVSLKFPRVPFRQLWGCQAGGGQWSGAEHESPERSCRLARPGEHLRFSSFKLMLCGFDASLSSEP